MQKIKHIVIILLCWFSFGSLACWLIEQYAFWPILQLLPGYSQWALGEDAYVLLQYSKKSLVPHDYIAILGDSYAYGTGEWQNQVISQRQPDFHAGHLLHHKTSRDVVTFGHPGASNISSLVLLPNKLLNAVRHIYHYDIDDPSVIIVYFYEGNDLTDNVEHLSYILAKGGYDKNRIFEENYFQNLLSVESQSSALIYPDTFLSKLSHGFILPKFFLETTVDMIQHSLNQSTVSASSTSEKSGNAGVFNSIHMNGKTTTISDSMESMGLGLSADEFKLSTYVFEQAIIFLKKRFPDSKIGIVYIPSGLSSYWLATDTVSTRYHGQNSTLPALLVNATSNKTCQAIQRIALTHGLGFIDSRDRIRTISKKELIHDPNDWLHFNKTGYTALSEALFSLTEQLNYSAPAESCATI